MTRKPVAAATAKPAVGSSPPPQAWASETDHLGRFVEPAVRHARCPECQAAPGVSCQTPGGRERPPHQARYTQHSNEAAQLAKLQAWNDACGA